MISFRPSVLKQSLDLQLKESRHFFHRHHLRDHIARQAKDRMLSEITKSPLRFRHHLPLLDSGEIASDDLRHDFDIISIEHDNASAELILDVCQRILILRLTVVFETGLAFKPFWRLRSCADTVNMANSAQLTPKMRFQV